MTVAACADCAASAMEALPSSQPRGDVALLRSQARLSRGSGAMHKSVGRTDTKTSLASRCAACGVSRSCCLRCLAIRLMNYELRRDEELYVPPIRLLEESTDSTWTFSTITRPDRRGGFTESGQLTGSEYLLLDGRLGVLAGWLVYAAGIGAVSFALTRSGLASWCIVVLSLANELFLDPNGHDGDEQLPAVAVLVSRARAVHPWREPRPGATRAGLPWRGSAWRSRWFSRSARWLSFPGGDRRLLLAAL